MNARFNPARSTALLAVTFGAALLSAGCDQREETPVADVTAPAAVVAPAVTPPVTAPAVTTGVVERDAAGADVKVADIASNWANYEGKTVTVVADVNEVKGPRALTLDEDSAMTGGIDDDLLVLTSKAGALAEIDDQWLNNKVRVTGVVHKFATVDIEREIGWDLDPELEAEYEGKRPVLIATAIERVK